MTIRVDDLGRAEGRLTVGPGVAAQVSTAFVIEHPRDLPVAVPPRR